MSTVIKVENLSKQYRLGNVGTGSIAHDLNRAWHRIRGKDDPYLKIGEENDRSVKGNSEYVWALRDINFQVKHGEVLGIIGRNGAGKSTLLKILSRTTSPTKGEIKIKGRVASLLEVGTGFHPELSGRENIFLNGAILGMTKQEIKRKFDEIVDFAGVERYIDTPVKRYSSGMYVRLAFGVAAHLEPEILIVDEVLAVGDAEFQKKALGKMKSISGREGRTVLFVSHNLPAIKNICSTGLLLNNGKIKSYGNVDMVMESYFLQAKKAESFDDILLSKKQAFFFDWKILNGLDVFATYSREVCELCFDLIVKNEITNAEFGLVIRDFKGEIIYGSNSRDSVTSFITLNPGKFRIIFKVSLPIRAGLYEVDIAIVSQGKVVEQYVPINKLNIVSRLDTVLDDKWCGILNEKSIFLYDAVS